MNNFATRCSTELATESAFGSNLSQILLSKVMTKAPVADNHGWFCTQIQGWLWTQPQTVLANADSQSGIRELIIRGAMLWFR